jgi:hypothetical protein
LAACGPLGKVPLDAKPTSTPTPGPVLGQVPLGLAPPVCTPPEVSIDKITAFCANQAAGLGGATFVYHPDKSQMNFYSGDGVSCSYAANSNKVICSGPPNAQFEETDCTACRPPDAPDKYGTFTCAQGYANDGNGGCTVIDPNQEYPLCPPASHYDNDLQKCVDDGTGDPIPLCPAGFPYYLPDGHYCLEHAYPQVINCQTFTLQLGDCSVSPKGPGGGGMEISCPSGTTWDAGQKCCLNTDNRCQ